MARPHVEPLAPLYNLDWQSSNATDSLKTLIEQNQDIAKSVITWYVSAKDVKKRGATTTRVGTIVLTTVAALLTASIPILGSPSPNIGIGAAAAVAAAGILQAFDRYFGFSKAWMRYISAELKIRTALNAFSMSWPSLLSKWQGNEPSPGQIQEGITVCINFSAELDSIVRQETDQWIADFQASLKDLETATQAAADAAKTIAKQEIQRQADEQAKRDETRPGALSIALSNGEEFPAGWTIQFTDRDEQVCSGKTAVVENIGPGNVKIIIEGDDATGKTKRAELLVDIPAGKVEKLSAALA